MPPRIVVVGSLVMDLVVWADRRPVRGETLLGRRFGMFPGGKGFNQAVAAARMGAQVTLVGRTGDDAFARPFLDLLAAEGMATQHVFQDPVEGTGVAIPLVEADGDNSIVMVPRANGRLSEADVEVARPALEACDALLLQLETPVAASTHAARLAGASGATVILNPAPAMPIPDELWKAADILVPNELEAALLARVPEGNPHDAALALLRHGLKAVIVTLGSEGAVLVISTGVQAVPAHHVPVVDSVAAGDAFCGALAVAVAEGRPLLEAVEWANAAGALAVTVAGAAPSMPRRDAVAHMVRDGWQEETP